jgi:glycosyltransferase involved in cell wall biosynthesis
MKIALIGPGIMPIPPVGWGAVEILIWDYFLELTNQGHSVDIINKIRRTSAEQVPNTPYTRDLITEINQGNYDMVHIHYDCLCHIIPLLTCNKIAITSHYPYIDQLDKHASDGFHYVFQFLCHNHRHSLFALSQKDYDTFVRFAQKPEKVFLLLNGANHTEITPLDRPGNNKDASIYMGKIEPRKNQQKYQALPNVHFYGKCDNAVFTHLPNYKGEKEHGELMQIMREYGSAVLLSSGENGTPLVIKEALMAGLPVVVNKHSMNDLDETLPFIDIIPDDKLDDLEYIDQVLIESRTKSHLRDIIRKYAEENFAWAVLIRKYADLISNPEFWR